MWKGKYIFIVWMVMISVLFFLPGFEFRGLALGLIPGYWVLSPFPELNPYILFPLMLLQVFFFVLLCAWLIGRAGMKKVFWTVAVPLIFLSGILFAFRGMNYEQWRHSPTVRQSAESAEVKCRPTPVKYCRLILVPRMTAGGLLGYYTASGACALASAVILFRKKRWHRQ